MTKKLLLSLSFAFIIALSFNTQAQAQETLTISTYYPSPFGIYNLMQLFPHDLNSDACAAANIGTTAYHDGTVGATVTTAAGLYYCDTVGWQQVVSFGNISGLTYWDIDAANDIYNTNTGDVGIGTGTPVGTARLNVVMAAGAPIIKAGDGSTYVNGSGAVVIGEDCGSDSRGTTVIGGFRSYETSGGVLNTRFNTILGGSSASMLDCEYATILGGASHVINDAVPGVLHGFGTIVGGSGNNISANGATVIGGSGHTASGLDSVIIGGSAHGASGQEATVIGGSGNVASGIRSIALGINASATHANSFVWAGSAGGASAAADTFNVYAGGGSYFDGNVNVANGSFTVPNNTFGFFAGVPLDFAMLKQTQLEFRKTGNSPATIRFDDGSNNALRFVAGSAGGVSETMRIDSTGVGIFNPAPAFPLDVSGNAQIGGDIIVTNLAGPIVDVQVNAAGLLIRGPSSRRYKKDITDLKVEVSNLFKLRPVKFRWKEDGTEDIGLIAEEVAEHVNDLVIYNKEGQPESVRYKQLGVMLLQVVKEQQAQIEELKARVEKLEKAK